MTVQLRGCHKVRASNYAVSSLYLTVPPLWILPTVHQKNSKATLYLVAGDAVQSVESLLSRRKALPVLHPQLNRKKSVVVHARHSSIWEVETEGSGV